MLVNVELLLSIDLVLPAAASSMDANAVFDTEVLLPSSEPSLRRSLDTVLLLTRGEVWAKLAALSIKEEDDAKADSCCTLFDSCCTDSCFWVIMLLLLLEDSCFCATMLLLLLMLADSCLLEIALDSCWTLTSPILARETDSRAREDDLRWE